MYNLLKLLTSNKSAIREFSSVSLLCYISHDILCSRVVEIFIEQENGKHSLLLIAITERRHHHYPFLWTLLAINRISNKFDWRIIPGFKWHNFNILLWENISLKIFLVFDASLILLMIKKANYLGINFHQNWDAVIIKKGSVQEIMQIN